MLHCDLRLRRKVASDLRFRAAIPKPETPYFCGISGDSAPSTRKSLAIAIVRFWCATDPAVPVCGLGWVPAPTYTPFLLHESFGWHLCRTELPQKFNRNGVRKLENMIQNVPENV